MRRRRRVCNLCIAMGEWLFDQRCRRIERRIARLERRAAAGDRNAHLALRELAADRLGQVRRAAASESIMRLMAQNYRSAA